MNRTVPYCVQTDQKNISRAAAGRDAEGCIARTGGSARRRSGNPGSSETRQTRGGRRGDAPPPPRTQTHRDTPRDAAATLPTTARQSTSPRIQHAIVFVGLHDRVLVPRSAHGFMLQRTGCAPSPLRHGLGGLCVCRVGELAEHGVAKRRMAREHRAQRGGLLGLKREHEIRE